MNVLAYLLMLAIAAAAAIFSGMLSLVALTHSLDFSYWLFVLPAGALGLLTAIFVYHVLHWPDDPLLRRAGFVFVTSVVTCLACSAAWGVFIYLGHQDDPKEVYVRGPSSFVLTLPTEVGVDENVTAKVQEKEGPWLRMRYRDLKTSGEYFDARYYPVPNALPALAVRPPSRRLVLRTEPFGYNILNDLSNETGEANVMFRRAGTVRIWAETERNSSDPVKSNVVVVTVHEQE